MALLLDQQAAARPAVVSGKRVATLFVATSFLGSFLLFLVQPMVAKFLLPLVGGSTALWTTAMVFFQVTLLIGYGFAHLSTNRLGMRRHVPAQLVILAVPLLVLPIAVPGGWQLDRSLPTSLWVLWALLVMVALPFFALATASPTLQRWFSVTTHPHAGDPYFLYAAGNVGSVLALLIYPLVLEPLLSSRGQAQLWSGVYVAFLVGFVACGAVVRRADTVAALGLDVDIDAGPAIDWSRRGRWLLWSFVPSALMLGVTAHISTDLGSFPLLWVIPLLLYLSTFIIAFGADSDRRSGLAGRVVWLGAPIVVLTFFAPVSLALLLGAIHLVWFFAAALVAHSRLAADRPAASRLTEFYVMLSVGGALGGVFASLLAPAIFESILEYPIAIGLVLLITPLAQGVRSAAFPSGAPALTALVALVLAVLLVPEMILALGLAAAILAYLTRGAQVSIAILLVALMATPGNLPSSDRIFRDRSFFGMYTVTDQDDGSRIIQSGTTLHGRQFLDAQRSGNPVSYYFGSGPAGQVFLSRSDRDEVGVVGLGAGALAGFGRPGDKYTFYEIDQLVVDIASDTDLFTYLADSQADITVDVVDGRLGLQEAKPQFDIVVVDAFSSDAIPIHLLTREAVQLYLDRLAPGGVVLMHISNRHFDLGPVLGRIGSDLGATALIQTYAPDAAELEAGASNSDWIVMAEDPASLDPLDLERWDQLSDSGPLWTDDWSNPLAALKF